MESKRRKLSTNSGHGHGHRHRGDRLDYESRNHRVRDADRYRRSRDGYEDRDRPPVTCNNVDYFDDGEELSRHSRRNKRVHRDNRDRNDHARPNDNNTRSDSEQKDKNIKGEDTNSLAKPPAVSTEVVKAPTLGAYVPPAKLRMMQNAIQDKSSLSYQRLAWEALKKSVNGLINKVSVSNITIIVRELIKENLILGRGAIHD